MAQWNGRKYLMILQIVSVNIDSKLEYRFDPGRCFAIVRESWRLLSETTSMAIPVFIRIILLSDCPLS